MSATDDHRMAGVAEAAEAAAALGMTFVPGIEIPVHRGKDVHVLAYFLHGQSPELRQLLSEQR